MNSPIRTILQIQNSTNMKFFNNNKGSEPPSKEGQNTFNSIDSEIKQIRQQIEIYRGIIQKLKDDVAKRENNLNFLEQKVNNLEKKIAEAPVQRNDEQKANNPEKKIAEAQVLKKDVQKGDGEEKTTEKVKEESGEKRDVEESVPLGEVITLDVNPKETDVKDEQPDELGGSFDWIFFGAPENGCFKVVNQKKNGESNVCYRINVKTLAIEYIHSKFDIRALSYRNEYLLPICDFVNNVTSASSIKMEQPGKVIKQGEDYVIDSKNKIKIKLL